MERGATNKDVDKALDDLEALKGKGRAAHDKMRANAQALKKWEYGLMKQASELEERANDPSPTQNQVIATYLVAAFDSALVSSDGNHMETEGIA